MKSTTVKIDAFMLKEISEVLPAGETVTEYVRNAVCSDVRERKMRKAALQYQQFLEKNPEEKEELDTWEMSKLNMAPLKTSARTKK